MTDRISLLTVALDQPVRTDDIQPLVDAIRMLRGVQDVSVNIDDPSQRLANTHARMGLGERVIKIIRDEVYGGTR